MACRSYYVFPVSEAYEIYNHLTHLLPDPSHKVSHCEGQLVHGEVGFPLLYISSLGDDAGCPCHSTNTGKHL